MDKLFDNINITRDSGVYYLKINELNYVGSSIDVKSRLLEHRSKLKNNKHENKRMQNIFKKYGEDKCSFSVLEVCDESLRLEKEKYYIDLLGPVLNNKLDPVNQNNSITQSKVVYQFDKSGKLLAEYISVKEASRKTKISHSSIIKCCNKNLNSAGGYLWSYDKNAKSIYDLERSKWKWKEVVHINTGQIFSNIAKAARFIYEEGDNFNSLCASISSVCNKKGKLVKKIHKFSYMG